MDTTATGPVPAVPDFTPARVPPPSSSNGSMPPTKKVGFSFSKKTLMIIGSIFIALLIPVIGFFVYTQNQTTSSDAAVTAPTCHNFVVPPGFTLHGGCYACSTLNKNYQNQFNKLTSTQRASLQAKYFVTGSKTWIMVKDIQSLGLWNKINCPDPKLNDPETGPNVLLASAWNVTQHQCTAPPDMQCKKKSPQAYECRPGGIIGPCTNPTPTVVAKVCEAPYQCLAADLCETDTSGAIGGNTGGTTKTTPGVGNVAPTSGGVGAGSKPTVPAGGAAGGANATPASGIGGSSGNTQAIGGTAGNTTIGTGACPAANQLCCMPKRPKCEAPKACVPINPNNPDPNLVCQDGTIDKEGTAACSTEAICCEAKIPTPTSTVTPTMTPTATPTPPVSQACIVPKIKVEVNCLTCGGQ